MSATIIGKNTIGILNCHFSSFFMINLRFSTSNSLSTYRKTNLLFTNSICLVFSSLENQRRSQPTKVLYSWLKIAVYKPLKVANIFSSVYVIDTICLDKYFLFPLTGRHCFYESLLLPCVFFTTAMFLLASEQVIWKKYIFNFLSPEYYCNANTKVPK